MTDALEHMGQEWVAHYDKANSKWCVVILQSAIAGKQPAWWVADVTANLPGDDTGESTARAICAEHNAAVLAHVPEATGVTKPKGKQAGRLGTTHVWFVLGDGGRAVAPAALLALLVNRERYLAWAGNMWLDVSLEAYSTLRIILEDSCRKLDL